MTKTRGGAKPYRSGRNFEYRVRDHFRKLGYHVHRSHGSKGPYDLIVLGRRFSLLVQCKKGAALGPAEWNVLYEMAEKCGAIPVLVTNEKRKICCYQMLAPKIGRARQPMALFTCGFNEEIDDAAYHQFARKRPAPVEGVWA